MEAKEKVRNMDRWKKMMFTGMAAMTLAACGTGGTTDPGTPSVDDDTAVDTVDPVESGANTTTETETPGTPAVPGDPTTDPEDPTANIITMYEALDIYWTEFPDAQIEEIDFDDDRQNEWTYEITGVFDNREYEMELNAMTGDIIDIEEDDADNDEDYLTIDALISPADAIAEARNHVDPAAKLEGWQLDIDDGRTVYEVEFEGTDDRDVKIDAETGEMIEIDD